MGHILSIRQSVHNTHEKNYALFTLTKLFFEKLTNGLILNISSLADRYPDPTLGLYSSSKTALNLFFETMAVENKEVKIITVLPSYVDTPMQHQIRAGADFDWMSMYETGRHC